MGNFGEGINSFRFRVEAGCGTSVEMQAVQFRCGDEQVFDLYGYPLPGRQFALSIRKEYRP
mgnify:CR=1 FL=1